MNKNNAKALSCNCEQANSFCDKIQYDEAEDWEIRLLKDHLAKCPDCQEYSQKNEKITQLFTMANLNVLKESELSVIKNKLSDFNK